MIAKVVAGFALAKAELKAVSVALLNAWYGRPSSFKATPK